MVNKETCLFAKSFTEEFKEYPEFLKIVMENDNSEKRKHTFCTRTSMNGFMSIHSNAAADKIMSNIISISNDINNSDITDTRLVIITYQKDDRSVVDNIITGLYEKDRTNNPLTLLGNHVKFDKFLLTSNFTILKNKCEKSVKKIKKMINNAREFKNPLRKPMRAVFLFIENKNISQSIDTTIAIEEINKKKKYIAKVMIEDLLVIDTWADIYLSGYERVSAKSQHNIINTLVKYQILLSSVKDLLDQQKNCLVDDNNDNSMPDKSGKKEKPRHSSQQYTKDSCTEIFDYYLIHGMNKTIEKYKDEYPQLLSTPKRFNSFRWYAMTKKFPDLRHLYKKRSLDLVLGTFSMEDNIIFASQILEASTEPDKNRNAEMVDEIKKNMSKILNEKSKSDLYYHGNIDVCQGIIDDVWDTYEHWLSLTGWFDDEVVEDLSEKTEG